MSYIFKLISLEIISLNFIVSMLILILDAIGMFLILTHLLNIPGNKKILRIYSDKENSNNKKSNKKEAKIAIFIMILLVLAANFLIFVFL